jgi:cytochrome P450
MAKAPKQPYGCDEARHRQLVQLFDVIADRLNGYFLAPPHQRRQDGEIYTLQVEAQTVVVLSKPAHARHVLRDHVRNYLRSPVAAHADRRQRQVRLLRPLFHRQQLAGLVQLMVETIDAQLQQWEHAGAPLDLTAGFSTLALQLFARSILGGNEDPRVLDQIVGAVQHLSRYARFGVLARPVPEAETSAYEHALQTFNAICLRAIADSRRALASGLEQMSLLALLLNVADEETGEPLGDQQVRDQLLGLFLPSFDNIARMVSAAIDLLSEHPDKASRLQAELDTVLGGETPSFRQLGQLTYTRMVLQETLRLRPPQGQMWRVAMADDIIDGHPIAAGTLVLLPTALYQRDPEFWPNADAFEPERFSPERASERQPLTWLPFGGGERPCLGKDFSLIEGQLILAMALQRFAFAATGDQG